MARRRTKPNPCGTDAGYSGHRRYGEPTCEPCRRAHSLAEMMRREARVTKRRRARA